MEADCAEFPFVATLPRKERSVIRRLWDDIHEICQLQKEKGPVLPASVAADALGVSPQRVFQIVQDGRLEAISMHGRNFIVASSLIEFAKLERSKLGGRPSREDSDLEAVGVLVKKLTPKK
jgi:hypothetical protein